LPPFFLDALPLLAFTPQGVTSKEVFFGTLQDLSGPLAPIGLERVYV
jgi:hypothetical protein